MSARGCPVVAPGGAEACGKDPTHVVTFGDGQKERTCHGCALFLQQVAQQHGTSVAVEKLSLIESAARG